MERGGEEGSIGRSFSSFSHVELRLVGGEEKNAMPINETTWNIQCIAVFCKCLSR